MVDANDDTITSIETPKSSYAMEVGEVRKGVGDENSFSDKGLVSVSKNKSISVDDSRHNAYNSADSVAYQSSVQTSDTPSDNDEDVIGSLQSSNMFQKTYEELNISSKISNLFRYVDHMQPKEISLETELKCFIPPYVPTIGEVDPFIKVPRPDGKTDGLGLYVVDEPAKEQSDAAVLELQLRSQTKKRQTGNALVRSIENAERDPHEVDRWIQNIDDLRKSKPAPEVVFKHPMPSFDTIIMSDFRRELRENVRSGSISLPNPNMDLSLHDYSRLLCCLLDIPVHEKNVTLSLYFMFSLCLECQEFEENFDDNL